MSEMREPNCPRGLVLDLGRREEGFAALEAIAELKKREMALESEIAEVCTEDRSLRETFDCMNRDIDSKIKRIGELEAQVADTGKTITRLCNRIWGLLYPDTEGWDYPDQAVNHVKVELERRGARVAALRGALEEARVGINDCYGGLGPSSTIWSNSTYDKGYKNAITAALTAFDHATRSLADLPAAERSKPQRRTPMARPTDNAQFVQISAHDDLWALDADGGVWCFVPIKPGYLTGEWKQVKDAEEDSDG